ncbi:transcriptional regulator, LysR family [Halobacteriovorax sp. BALOs_7]|uniref:LysR family transcriptional regulator n=1 Tax=Halobacteriovorax sp. BALOs_7 TaxID=2109558 RepID=UPI000EA0C06F|nr:LysR family transcriptional regulator [Halobacteriovorax sp. BALOs_7]AYF43772.1 transcriptional regulator, LysR family [Halobacteriovorax sp. BALOs_7]
MNIRNFDLNLLVIFKDLFNTLSVSQTATNLGLSQPAVSHALNRLRDSLNDELFIRTARTFIPTDKAIQLGSFLETYLNELESNLFEQEGWDSHNSSKEFRVSGTAFDSFMWVPKLMESLVESAPRLKVTMKGIVLEDFLDRMIRGEIDLSFAGNLDEINNFSIETLGTHDFCIIASKSNSQYKKKISLKQYLKAGHVLYTPTEKPGSDIDNYLSSIGESRNILVKTSYLNSIPRLVEKRNMLSMVPLAYGKTVAKYFDLKLYDVPFEVSPFKHQMVWHKSRQNSSSHKWLRDYIRDSYWDFIQEVS